MKSQLKFDQQIEKIISQLETEIIDEIRSKFSDLEIFSALTLTTIRSLPPGSETFLHLNFFGDYEKMRSSFKTEQSRSKFRLRAEQFGAHDTTEISFQQLRGSIFYGDAEGADDAITKICRTSSAFEIFGGIFKLGMRDLSGNGRKIIATVQTWRLLQTIDWKYAAPLLRSLVRFLSELPIDDRSWLESEDLAFDVRKDWQLNFSNEITEISETHDYREAIRWALDQINLGTNPKNLWSAVRDQFPNDRVIDSLYFIENHAYDPDQRLHALFQAIGYLAERKENENSTF